MLPMPIRSSYSTPSGAVPEYLWRVFNVGQMDFQFAFSQMVDLLRAPAEVYKSTAIRKRLHTTHTQHSPPTLINPYPLAIPHLFPHVPLPMPCRCVQRLRISGVAMIPPLSCCCCR